MLRGMPDGRHPLHRYLVTLQLYNRATHCTSVQVGHNSDADPCGVHPRRVIARAPPGHHAARPVPDLCISFSRKSYNGPANSFVARSVVWASDLIERFPHAVEPTSRSWKVDAGLASVRRRDAFGQICHSSSAFRTPCSTQHGRYPSNFTPSLFLEPLVPSWNHFVDIHRQTLTKSSTIDF